MKLTPIEIRQKQFNTKFRGFDVREVDLFLEEMADAFEKILGEKSKLKEQISRLRFENQSYKDREETLKRAMHSSYKVLARMKKNAEKAAELIIADAEVKAERILNRANNRLAQLHEDMAELKRQRMQIEAQIRSIIETHIKLIEMRTEEMKVIDEEYSKVKMLTRVT